MTAAYLNILYIPSYKGTQ